LYKEDDARKTHAPVPIIMITPGLVIVVKREAE